MNPELDALALDTWPEVIGAIDALVDRSERGAWESVRARTSLSADDARTDPFQTSHAVQMLLNAAIDNLHGVRSLIWGPIGQRSETPIIHQAAHYLLARGAIENAAAALWILAPSSRHERIRRTLRWHVQNVTDEANALADLPVFEARESQPRIERLAAVCAAATGAEPPRFRTGYTTTETLRFASSLEPGSQIPSIFVWRLCSGFAHGRPWSSLHFQDLEKAPTLNPEIFLVRMTSDLTRALIAPHCALQLLERVLKLYEQRNLPH